LVENRPRESYWAPASGVDGREAHKDGVLPDEGIIVYRVDESMLADRKKVGSGPVRIMDADPSWPRYRKATFNLERPLYWNVRDDLAVFIESREGNRYEIQILRGLREPRPFDSDLDAAKRTMASLPEVRMHDVREFCKLEAADGKTITARYYPAVNSRVAVLMVPGYDGSAESLAPLPYVFYRGGVTALAIDLRTSRDFRTAVSSGETLENEFAPLPKDLRPALLDVEAGIAFLRSKGYENIGILGASYGGALALKTAFADPGVDAAAVLSLPFGESHQINVTADLTSEERLELPIWFITTTEDVVSPTAPKVARQVKRLCQANRPNCRFRFFPGLSHGNDILRSHRHLEEELIEWFSPARQRP
jgi:dienelactone hydrolase